MAKKVERTNPFEKNAGVTPPSSDLSEDTIKELRDILLKNPAIARMVTDNFLGKDVENQLKNIVKITAGDWKKTHPMQKGCASDAFYSKFANLLQKEYASFNFQRGLPEDLFRECAMGMAAYFEDVKSETGVWKAVRNLYRAKYGNWLPFFDTNHNDYFEDDLNLEDLKFLIWQTWNRCGQPEGRIFSPYSMAVDKMSEIAYDAMVEEFDEAPESTRVTTILKAAFKKCDYYELRTLCLWLAADNKLTSVPWKRDIMLLNASEFLDSKNINLSEQQAYYFQEAMEGISRHISMLGCPSYVLLAEIARDYGFAKTADSLESIDYVPHQSFEVMGMKDKSLLVKNIVGEEFEISIESLGGGKGMDLSKVKGMSAALVKFGGFWMVNGLAGYAPAPPAWENDPTHIVSHLPDEMRERLRDVVRDNKGRRLYYCKDIEEVESIVKLIKPVPMNMVGNRNIENLLLMISDDSFPVLMENVCQIFSDRNNPFYDSKVDREKLGNESRNFIILGIMPDDVAEYVQEKHLLPHAYMYASQGKRVGKEIVQKNIRFLNNFFSVKVESPYEWEFEEDETME